MLVNTQETTGCEIQKCSEEYIRVIQLPEYQREVSPLKNGVLLNENIPSEILTAIDWESSEGENVSIFNTPLGIQYVVYSQPAIYSYMSDFPKIVDLCIVSSDKDIALRAFKEKKEESDKIKEKRLKLLEPYLKDIEDVKGVSFLSGRGSTFDKRRICTVHDDVDISCFIEFSSREELEELFKNLKEVYWKIARGLNVKVSEISFTNDRGATGKTIIDTICPMFEVSLDLIATAVLNEENRVRDIKENDPYIVDTFSNYTFLGGDKSKFEKAIRLFED